jgi:hypothetical protein
MAGSLGAFFKNLLNFPLLGLIANHGGFEAVVIPQFCGAPGFGQTVVEGLPAILDFVQYQIAQEESFIDSSVRLKRVKEQVGLDGSE